MEKVKGYLKTFTVNAYLGERLSQPKKLTVIHLPDANDLVIILEPNGVLRVSSSSIIPPKFQLIRVIEVPTHLIRIANELRQAQNQFNKHNPRFKELFELSD